MVPGSIFGCTLPRYCDCAFETVVAPFTLQMWLLLLNLLVGGAARNPGGLQGRVSDLSQRIWSSRWNTDTEYFPREIYPPLQWETKKGLFPSYVHINFHGGLPQGLLRNLYHFPDNNAFVTLFVLQALLESYELGAVSIEDSQLVDSILAVIEHRDKNTPIGTPIYSFWNQKRGSDSTYQSWPENIGIPISTAAQGLDDISGFFDGLNLTDVIPSSIGKIVSNLMTHFKIPSDADDTACNLALGTALLRFKDSFPVSSSLWLTANQNIQSIFQYFIKYAYRPFSNDESESIIDSRTYFWMHDFLNKHSQSEDLQSVAFISTWFQSLKEIRAKNGQGTVIPFNLNNVDVSVCANSFFGIASYLVLHPEESRNLMSKDLQDILNTTSLLLEYVLEHDILHERGDLALLYYPPVYDFYFFVSRAIHMIDSYLTVAHPHYDFINAMSSRLAASMRDYGMKQIFKSASFIQDSVLGKRFAFWDDFLGNSDGQDIFQRTTYEDRVFSTAVTLNAILDCWTLSIRDPNTKAVRRQWIPTAHYDVQSLVESGINWILDRSAMFPRENAFFSGSNRRFVDSLPVFYPTNVFEYLNGTAQTCYGKSIAFKVRELVAGVRGSMTDAEFSAKVKQPCGDVPVPTEDPGNNCDNCFFPYWSAPVLTDAMEMLLLSKYLSIDGVQEL